MIEQLQAQGDDLRQLVQVWLKGNFAGHPFIPQTFWLDALPQVSRQLSQMPVWVHRNAAQEIDGFLGLRDHHIEGLFVLPEAQGHGIGTALLQTVQATHSVLDLNVYTKNTRARQFYAQAGFRPISTQRDPATQEPDLVLRWQRPD